MGHLQDKKDKQNLLNAIVKQDAKVSNEGVKLSKLISEYASKYSEFNKGDRVLYREWFKNEDESVKNGIVSSIYYDTSRFFRYVVIPHNKNWSTTGSRHPVIIQLKGTGTKSGGIIKKVTE